MTREIIKELKYARRRALAARAIPPTTNDMSKRYKIHNQISALAASAASLRRQ
jgi:hypothetical protein